MKEDVCRYRIFFISHFDLSKPDKNSRLNYLQSRKSHSVIACVISPILLVTMLDNEGHNENQSKSFPVPLSSHL